MSKREFRKKLAERLERMQPTWLCKKVTGDATCREELADLPSVWCDECVTREAARILRGDK